MARILEKPELERLRTLLADPPRRDRMWPALAAAAAFAVSSLLFATAMVLAPPLASEPAPRVARAEAAG